MIILLSLCHCSRSSAFSYFYLRNQMATEPRRTLLQTFLYGAFLTFPIMFLQYVLTEEGVFDIFIFKTYYFQVSLKNFLNGLCY